MRELKKWRKYLKESVEFPYQLYVDMDGVLVSFVEPVLAKLNHELHNPPENMSSKQRKAYNKMQREMASLGRDTIVLQDIAIEKEKSTKSVRNWMYRSVGSDADWWANLPWTPDGQELWNYVKDFQPHPIVLTAPIEGGPCEEGKQRWVEKNLGISERHFVCTADKYLYASPTALLIDDMEKFYKAFKAAGGNVIVHTSTVETIKQLEDYKRG